jgi:nucleoside-diphosphate-sugar epimerase
MKILVTGGTGVVGRPVVDRLVARGHTVRLLSRQAEHDAAEWPRGVEAHPGDVTEEASVTGAAEGCDAVLHMVAVVREAPPHVTFHNVNVQGTRRIVREAERAGVERLVYVSSLGAGDGASGYHRSKRAGEEIARGFRGSWLICRPGNVYGPGDAVVSLLLELVRTLPVIPVIAGDTPFQPIWAGDLGEALARVMERPDLDGSVQDMAGPERTTLNDLLRRLGDLTGRSPRRFPVPAWMAKLGADLLERAGVAVPVTRDQVIMLVEENVIPIGSPNALTDVLGVEPTPLADGLRQLVGTLPG